MVVVAGVTEVLDPVTAPTPWLIDSVVAPETLHDSVEDWPDVMLDCVAVKDEITGALVGGAEVPPASPEPPHARMHALAVATAVTTSFEERPEGTIEMPSSSFTCQINTGYRGCMAIGAASKPAAAVAGGPLDEQPGTLQPN
jgi:hypothetical protein